ncbi:metal ABC transporter solute-binding protein, Zn/Mn family [Marinoscillum furvescens]|uniref:Manganese/zinc/iron transport system substrate-binding protein n=1 Tax=Marinoscillum furvescens DSM 4134 TaxID=1122208 RepID=A0A3D9KY48_MARFU|nr:zinc ABC transporter substrate-binding protein [Marinoscillum furvescens]RED94351.1 manganese/zinc/iron transport system substrate-binding protein [Marinoscillum furvescens DSM 4134]
MNRFFTLFFIIFFWGCTPSKEANNDLLKVVSTTGMLHDAVVNIAGDKMDAEALMGPGVDPHLYKATQGDLAKLNKADIIIYNGLLLEGKMGDILQKLSRQKTVLAAAENLNKTELLSSVQYENTYDPHVWFDVNLWKQVVQNISTTLQQVDSTNANYYQQNTVQYLEELEALHSYATSTLASIPEQQRILVTAHDAFRYFGRAYNIRVEGIQGISTVSDFGLRDIADITDLIIDNEIKAIFVETSVSDKAIKAVLEGCKQRGHEVKLGGYLYSDAMGEPGTAEGTYIGMFRSNVATITQSLK